MTDDDIRTRLEYLRAELRAERISMGELHELQGLAEHIEPGDVELLEAAGVPEHPGDDQRLERALASAPKPDAVGEGEYRAVYEVLKTAESVEHARAILDQFEESITVLRDCIPGGTEDDD